MQKYVIPHENADLKKYALKRSLGRILLYLLYLAVWGIGYWVYLETRPLAKPFEWWAMLIFISVALISGWFIFRIGRFFTHRQRTIRIIGEKISRDWGRGKTRRGSTSVDYHTYVTFITENTNGKRGRVRLQLFDDGYDMYYRQGDTIVCFSGLNYPISLQAEARGEHICTVCGVRKYPKLDKDGVAVNDMTVCESCGHSLIDVDILEQYKR